MLVTRKKESDVICIERIHHHPCGVCRKSTDDCADFRVRPAATSARDCVGGMLVRDTRGCALDRTQQITHHPDIANREKGPMDRQLGVIRAAYAKQTLAAAGVVDNGRLEAIQRNASGEPVHGRCCDGSETTLRRPTPIGFFCTPMILSAFCPSGESTTGNHRCTRISFARHRRGQANTWCIQRPFCVMRTSGLAIPPRSPEACIARERKHPGPPVGQPCQFRRPYGGRALSQFRTQV
jgi:hypothetical protein